MACCDLGVAASIRLHRGDPAARRDLDEVEYHAERIGDRTVGPLVLARSLDREQAAHPAEALAILMAGLAKMEKEIEQNLDLFADAVRLATSVGDDACAAAVAQRAEPIAQTSTVPHRVAVAPALPRPAQPRSTVRCWTPPSTTVPPADRYPVPRPWRRRGRTSPRRASAHPPGPTSPKPSLSTHSLPPIATFNACEPSP